MEVMYQRARIQEESLHYEHKKHAGELPIIGVNTFLPDELPDGVVEVDLIRSTEAEKATQIEGVDAFQSRYPDANAEALARLRAACISGENVFTELMETVKTCSLGQISDTLFGVGGQYRRNV